MSLISQLKSFFTSLRPGRAAPEKQVDESGLDELADRLQEMRGENTTIVDSPGNFGPSRNAIENLTNAARDGRIINRSNEDDAVSDLETYRSTD